jgi:hypothetical protein
VLAILGPWAQQVSKVSSDELGRWVSATLTGSDGESVSLFSLYNMVDTNLRDAGPSTVFAQQYPLLRLSGVLHPNPRRQCIVDLNRVIAAAPQWSLTMKQSSLATSTRPLAKTPPSWPRCVQQTASSMSMPNFTVPPPLC